MANTTNFITNGTTKPARLHGLDADRLMGGKAYGGDTPTEEGYLFDSEGFPLTDSEGYWLDTTE